MRLTLRLKAGEKQAPGGAYRGSVEFGRAVQQAFNHLLEQALQRGGALRFERVRVLFGHVIHLRQFELDRMLLLLRLPVGAGDVTALEAAVQHVGVLLLLLAAGDQPIAQRQGAAFAAVGAEVEIRQLAVEQPRITEAMECASNSSA